MRSLWFHPVDPRPLPTMRQIVAEVALKHDTTPELIIAHGRLKAIVWARQEVMWRIRLERPDLSYPQIGRFFSRDHTTIIHGVRAHAARLSPPCAKPVGSVRKAA